MKFIGILLTVFISFSLFLNFENTTGNYQKKISKSLNSVWYGQNIETKTVKLPDTLLDVGFKLNSVYIKDSLVGYYCVKDAFGCHKGGCDKIDSTIFITEYEIFVFMVVLSPDLKIKKVDVVDYQSNYGFQIASKKWLKQFIGFEGCEMQYEKNVDAISGATTSAKSMVKNINWICEEMIKFRKLGLI